MEGSGVGRPSKIRPYVPRVAEWLRENPNLSSAEVLRRVRLDGYRGGKTALYEVVRRLRAPGAGYLRCPRCRALLRDIAEFCPHCGSSLPSTFSALPAAEPEVFRAGREATTAMARRNVPTAPAVQRYLVIAAPDRQELYEYFKRTLGQAPAIEVVRERRVADRRMHVAVPPFDRRRRARRARPALDAELRDFGFAIVARD